MKKFTTYLTVVLVVLLQSTIISCEEMIEVDMPSNQINKQMVFDDVQTANAALAGLYASLREDSPLSGSTRGAGALVGTYADDLECFSISNINSEYDLYLNQQIETNASIYIFWSSAYKNIYIANAIISGAENSAAMPAGEKQRVRAEALLVRSILYLYLQQIFGDIPYVVSTDYQINRSLPKMRAFEVLERLEIDVAEALTSLDDDYRSTERVYPNRKVAELMLAKIHMLQENWPAAETLLKNIVDSPIYNFETDITKVFQKAGPHILWQLKPRNPGDPTSEALMYYFAGSAPVIYALSQDLIDQLPVDDLRRQHWTTAVIANGNTWYRANKYKLTTNNTTEYSIVYRLEEVYLLLAETLARQGKIQQALLYINPTRQRANLTPLDATASPSVLLQEILLENRKEFFTEMGHRFLDLKRIGALNTLSAVKPNWEEHHQLWPIPQREMEINPNLKPQNNGY